MKSIFLSFFLLIFLLTACEEEEQVTASRPIAATFSLKEGLELPTAPDSYEEILDMIQTMVEEDVMEMEIPYHVNLVELELFEAYERAYGRAYQQINATHIEFTSNTSTYHIGYRITAEGDFFITFSRSDKEYTASEIAEQNAFFKEQTQLYFNELVASGRFSDQMSEMERIKVLFDFTMEELTYDFTLQPISFTAYGTVTTKEVVCQGYVALFNALLKLAGFEVEGVIGTAFEDDIGHIWTRVKLGENWHYFDPTYGDRPSFSPEEGDLLFNYTYFDMSDETMLYDRKTTHYLVNSETLVIPTT